MAVEFRCEKCGKLLTVEAEPGAKVRCQYCNAKVAVPAGLASLPRPQVPTGAAPPPPPPAGPPAAEAQADEARRQEALMGTMARLMPWVLSLFLHAGIVVILAFFTILSYSTKAAEGVTVPDARLSKRPGSRLNPARRRSKLKTKSMARTMHNWARRNDTLSTDQGRTKDPVPLHGLEGGSGGSAGDFGMRSGADVIPRTRFVGTVGNAHHIVLVVDCSGSMLDSFDFVKREMNKTITLLLPTQTFHVIFFVWKVDPKKDESPPRRLVNATVRNKREALEFIKGVQAHNRNRGVPDWLGPGVRKNTNPLAGLKRAFDVLASPPNKKPGKIIFLLTDGEFHDNEEVRRKIRRWNKKGDVRVNTILFYPGDPGSDDVKEFSEFLEQVARENGGTFKLKERGE